MVFVTYLPHLLVRFAPTLKSSHNYNLSMSWVSDSTSKQSRRQDWTSRQGTFWSLGVTAFFGVRVTHVNFKCNQGEAISTIFKEQREKRKYQQRVLDVEMGSFTPLVFGTKGGIGADCYCFLKRLTKKLSEKDEEPYHITITWVRILPSFEILRSVHIRLKGSTKFHKGISLMTAV